MLGRVEHRVLAGEDQRWLVPALGECVRNRCKFDGFGPGADNQPYVCEAQPSP
jgi:hypothetical protein